MKQRNMLGNKYNGSIIHRKKQKSHHSLKTIIAPWYAGKLTFQ